MRTPFVLFVLVWLNLTLMAAGVSGEPSQDHISLKVVDFVSRQMRSNQQTTVVEEDLQGPIAHLVFETPDIIEVRLSDLDLLADLDLSFAHVEAIR